ncbi:MAG: DUF3732 domain-containing protein [Bacteroidetes bacterium]|jgi:hypothetical protein|nr:DUF3732 domain-containing protein [Bacteroidota bacterium]MBT7143441.1 DUF3732 domain-containing protein [Bacteroidota bacterium]MBT7492678.1 DUF3732 domain-containing protein [Bacteroidota bacterium]
MIFILHEIKLWFKDDNSEPKSYDFLPNKINVISGDATTGKTSFWSIIDYCLLSGKMNIVNAISEKVDWFGIRFTINDKEISIVRKSPNKGLPASEVYYDFGEFPKVPKGNKEIAEIKSKLDDEFGITDALRFPYGKALGKTTFNLSYRHFLLFNSLTESIIGTSETFFDTTFYGKEEYDKALSHIFDLVIGVNDMENIKAKERIKELDEGIKKINTQEKRNQTINNNLERDIFELITKSKENKFIEYLHPADSVNEAIELLQNVIQNTVKVADNSKLFSEIDELYKKKFKLKTQINAIDKYRKEYSIYKKNLSKSADSLQPIEFLNTKLSDQLVGSYETQKFIESLDSSLKDIKKNLSKKIKEPIKVSGEIKDLKIQLQNIEKRINQLNEIKKNSSSEGKKYVVLGEIKYAFEQIIGRKQIKPIDTVELNSLTDEKIRLEKVPQDTEQIKFSMKSLLNESIQRNYNLYPLPNYQNGNAKFNNDEMRLKLCPEGEMFPLDNVGSKSNFMFMHLYFFLGLHEHIISLEQPHVPQFLFIDQPSIPYYGSKGNSDKNKLVNAFSLLNSFIDYIIKEKKTSFQIFMVEHAPQEYWIDNDLTYFHTVDEFIGGKGLIPSNIYKN